MLFFNNLERKRFLKLFWVLILQIFDAKWNILICKFQRNFKISTKALTGQWVQKFYLLQPHVFCIELTLFFNMEIISFFNKHTFGHIQYLNSDRPSHFILWYHLFPAYNKKQTGPHCLVANLIDCDIVESKFSIRLTLLRKVSPQLPQRLWV